MLTPAPVAAGIDELIDLSDILVPNEHEAIELAGTSDAEGAAAALSRRAGTVVVTLGSRGAVVAQAGHVVSVVPAHPVSPVDTTGAGDTFVGVLVAFLAQGSPLQRALEAASAAAGISVTRAGAAEAMPTRAEIDATVAALS